MTESNTDSIAEAHSVNTDEATIDYEGREATVAPSPGEVIVLRTGQSIHHSPTCSYVLPTDRTTWIVYPDPDRDLWRRILSSAPANQQAERARFARSIGLVNGEGGPVLWACEQCVVVPRRATSQRHETRPAPGPSLDEALAGFDRTKLVAVVTAADEHLRGIGEAFPLAAWPSMPLESYALGQPEHRDVYCRRVEFQTPEIGSISGGSARKHMIFFRRESRTWFHDAAFDDVQAAWRHLRDGFTGAFDIAGRSDDLGAIDAIQALRSGQALTAKSVFVYAPGRILPIYSRDHVRHFIGRLTGEPAPTGLEPFAAHGLLKSIVDADVRFDGWHPVEVMRFLYEWADPRSTTATVKVAPGENARFWDDCLRSGYICIGWDKVGDVSDFGSEDDFRAAFHREYLDEYRGNRSKATAKAKEVWRFAALQPGDRVVANRGTSEVIAVGSVTDHGYEWRPERAEHRHTVAVEWDTSYAQTLPEPEKRWGVVTVADVPARLWSAIKSGSGAPPSIRPVPIVDTVPPAPPEATFTALVDALERKGQAILFGPPGTGKTFTALRFAVWWLTREGEVSGRRTDFGTEDFRSALAGLSTPEGGQPAARLTQVTFHPSYGYEDFIQGFRPVADAGPGGGLRLAITDGVFKRVCAAAAADPDQPYLLLIDEINRGDLPKIFGELITLLERDKRGMTTVLPQSGEPFAVPANVHLIGTMNTADRSIRLLDTALRRRFAFIELMPDATLLEGALVGKIDLGDLLRELNARIVQQMGRERQIGHSFLFAGQRPIDDEAVLAAVVRNEVLPVLQEHAYEDYRLLAKVVGKRLVDHTHHRLFDLDDQDLVEALYAELVVGASPS